VFPPVFGLSSTGRTWTTHATPVLPAVRSRPQRADQRGPAAGSHGAGIATATDGHARQPSGVDCPTVGQTWSLLAAYQEAHHGSTPNLIPCQPPPFAADASRPSVPTGVRRFGNDRRRQPRRREPPQTVPTPPPAFPPPSVRGRSVSNVGDDRPQAAAASGCHDDSWDRYRQHRQESLTSSRL